MLQAEIPLFSPRFARLGATVCNPVWPGYALRRNIVHDLEGRFLPPAHILQVGRKADRNEKTTTVVVVFRATRAAQRVGSGGEI